MTRKAFLSLLLFLLTYLLTAQTVTTMVQSGSGIDESLIRSHNGTLYGTGYSNGTLSTFNDGNSTLVLDALDSPSEMAELSNGMIAVAESQGNRVVLFDPLNQTQQLLTSAIPNPAGIIKMPESDTILVSSTTTNTIYRVAPNGDTSWYLSSNLFNSPVSLLWDDSNSLFIANYSSGTIVKKTSNGSVIPFCKLPTSSLGHMIKVENMIYATGVFSHHLYEINIETASWNIYAGSTQGSIDGDLGIAQFNSPNGITASVSGDSLYISEYNTQAIRLISGILSTAGLNEKGHEPSVYSTKIWPNPIQASFFVQVEESNDPFLLQLFGSNGLLISTDLSVQEISPNVIQVKLPCKLPDGPYFLRFSNSSIAEIRKIIIRNE